MEYKNHGKKWYIEEQVKLAQYAKEGVTIEKIAELLGRKPSACAVKLARIYGQTIHKDEVINYLFYNIPKEVFDFKLHILSTHTAYSRKVQPTMSKKEYFKNLYFLIN